MLRQLWMVAVGLLLAGAAVESRAGLVALWSFDGTTIGSAPNTTVNSGSGTLTLANPSGGDPITSVSGTTLNDPRTSPTATPAAEFQSQHGGGRTFTILIQITGTASLQNYILTYAADVKTANTVSQSWAWSTTSSSSGFNNLGSLSGTLGTSFTTFTADFSSVAGLNNHVGSIWLQDTVTVTGNGEFLNFDNIQVTAVPEPVNMALAFFGVGFVAVALLKSRKLKAESRESV